MAIVALVFVIIGSYLYGCSRFIKESEAAS